jgi:NIMA-interacting peptidyl-prolyl cis-trans isomerase 1
MQQDQVRCSHILQKHNLSRNPFDSYRNKKVTRSKDEAMENILKIRDQCNNFENFCKLAKDFSECGSAANGGDLGFFSRGQMQKEFEEAAFKLNVGDLSEPVVSASGVHIILRTA